MVAYDPRIIEEYAAKLYRRAASIVVLCMISGLFPALVLAPGIAQAFNMTNGSALLAGAIAGVAVGAIVGNNMVFTLRLKAQVALCQVQIEKNTRPQPLAA